MFNDVSVLLENNEHFTFHEAKIIGLLKDLCVGRAELQHLDSRLRIDDGEKELLLLAQCFHKPLYYRYRYLEQNDLPDDVILDRAQGEAAVESWRKDFNPCSSKRNVFWAVVYQQVGCTQLAKLVVNNGANHGNKQRCHSLNE